MIAASGARSPSVVVLRLRSMRSELVNRYLNDVVDQHSEALKKGAIISVSDGQARVRHLPLDNH